MEGGLTWHAADGAGGSSSPPADARCQPNVMNLSAEVEVALAGTGTIPRTEYERWIRGDLGTRARSGGGCSVGGFQN
jgi:hypothetical protein